MEGRGGVEEEGGRWGRGGGREGGSWGRGRGRELGYKGRGGVRWRRREGGGVEEEGICT